MIRLVFGGIGNIVGQGENTGYQHFSFSHKYLQGGLFPSNLTLGLINPFPDDKF